MYVYIYIHCINIYIYIYKHVYSRRACKTWNLRADLQTVHPDQEKALLSRCLGSHHQPIFCGRVPEWKPLTSWVDVCYMSTGFCCCCCIYIYYNIYIYISIISKIDISPLRVTSSLYMSTRPPLYPHWYFIDIPIGVPKYQLQVIMWVKQ